MTPLHVAIYRNHYEIGRFLINYGADVNKIPPIYINNQNSGDQMRSNKKLCAKLERFQEHCIGKRDPISLYNFNLDDRINTVITPSNTCYYRNDLRTYYNTNINKLIDPLRNEIPNKWRLENLYEGPCDIDRENLFNEIRNNNN